MLAYHPRVHFRGPRHYELGLVLSSRRRKLVKKSARHRRFLMALRKKSKLPATKASPCVNYENLTTVIQKAQAMDSATLTQKFFKRLTFSSVVQQDAAKALFLSRLQAAHLKLSTSKRLPAKAARRAQRVSSVERLALKVARVTNSKRRELGL